MKRVILTIIIILLFSPVSNAISISLGEPAAAFSLGRLDGGTVSLSDYRKQILVIVFWRTGQERSVLALQDADYELRKYENRGVKVISIIEDSDDVEMAKKIISEKGIGFPVVVDKDRQAYGDYGIRVFPTTVFINKEGLLMYDLPSHALTYRSRLDGYVKRLLGEISDKELETALVPKQEQKDEATLEADRRYNLAMKFVEARMVDQAIDAAIRATEAKPDMAKSHILLGFLYLRSKETEKAIKAFDRAIELEPDSHDAKTGKGGALILKGETDSAITILQDASVANPYPQMTFYELGKAYELKGDRDKAIEMYKKAIEKIVKKQILPSSISKCQ